MLRCLEGVDGGEGKAMKWVDGDDDWHVEQQKLWARKSPVGWLRCWKCGKQWKIFEEETCKCNEQ